MTDLSIILVFGLIAGIHWLLEELGHKHNHAHWAILLAHPAILETLKDWTVHLLIYSHFALAIH